MLRKINFFWAAMIFSVGAAHADSSALLAVPTYVESFVQEFNLDDNWDTAALAREQQYLTKNLLSRLDRTERAQLETVQIGYQSGAMDVRGYYATLHRMLDQHGIALTSYPTFERFVRYLFLAQDGHPCRLVS